MVVGQFVLEYLNNHSLHAGYINYVLPKTTITNTLNHVETRTSVQNTSKIQAVGNLLRGFTLNIDQHDILKESKIMQKNFIASLSAGFVPHPGCRPYSIYTRIKLCDKH